MKEWLIRLGVFLLMAMLFWVLPVWGISYLVLGGYWLWLGVIGLYALGNHAARLIGRTKRHSIASIIAEDFDMAWSFLPANVFRWVFGWARNPIRALMNPEKRKAEVLEYLWSRERGDRLEALTVLMRSEFLYERETVLKFLEECRVNRDAGVWEEELLAKAVVFAHGDDLPEELRFGEGVLDWQRVVEASFEYGNGRPVDLSGVHWDSVVADFARISAEWKGHLVSALVRLNRPETVVCLERIAVEAYASEPQVAIESALIAVGSERRFGIFELILSREDWSHHPEWYLPLDKSQEAEEFVDRLVESGQMSKKSRKEFLKLRENSPWEDYEPREYVYLMAGYGKRRESLGKEA